MKDIVERLLEHAMDATLTGLPLEEAAQTIAALRAERDEAKAKLQEMQKAERKGKAAAAVMAELCAIIPIKDIIGATETGATLVAYYRSVLDRAEAAEARVKELERKLAFRNSCWQDAILERDEARNALEPFAKQAARYDPPEGDDNHPLWGAHTLTIGDVRRARAASSNREGGE